MYYNNQRKFTTALSLPTTTLYRFYNCHPAQKLCQIICVCGFGKSKFSPQKKMYTTVLQITRSVNLLTFLIFKV